MRKKLLFILCTVFVAAGSASAQTAKKTVTNADLEKFRQNRLQAEKDLRENYVKLGFPSPEEMQRQEAEASAERERLSAKLRRERLEREQLQLEQEYLRAQQQQQNDAGNVVYVQNSSSGGGYYPQVGVYYGRRHGFYYNRRYRQNGAYLPGGGYFGPTFNPQQGVQINTTPIRINTTGPTRRPVRIRTGQD